MFKATQWSDVAFPGTSTCCFWEAETAPTESAEQESPPPELEVTDH